MKKRIRDILKKEISMKILALGTFLALVLLLLPIVRCMMFSVPWYDDFNYARFTKSFYELKGDLKGALEGVLYFTRSQWHAWQGTYTSCFFMSCMPAVWGTDKYVYGLWFVLAVLLLGIFCLTKVLLCDVLKCRDNWSCLVVQSVLAAMVVVFIHVPKEGLFWYNAAVHYTAMHGFGMLLIAGLIKLVYVKGKIKTILLIIGSLFGAVLVGGVNNVTALQVGLVILSIIGFGLLFKKKRVLLLIPTAICYGVALYKNIGAPGNAKRMVHYVNMKTNPVEAILRSFQCAFTQFDDFTGWKTVAVLIMLLPVIYYIVTKVEFEFRYPGLILFWSICLYATGFTPTLYTMGHIMLGRANNVARITFQILLLVNMFYWMGWLFQYLKKKEKALPLKSTWSFYALMVMIMVGIFALEPNKIGEYSSYAAYYFVHSGEAYNYYHEYLERVEICESDEKNVVVRPFNYKPWILCPGDLSENADHETNIFMAQYFGKDSITCIAEEQEE